MTKKDELYNSVVDEMTKSDVKFPSYVSDTDVAKHINVLVNALWYLDGNKEKLTHQVNKLPDRFRNQFNEYNDCKKKKIAAPRIDSIMLKNHVTCLRSLLDKPFTLSWGDFETDVQGLMLSMDTYARYLDDANTKQTNRQSQNHPVRELSKNVHILYVPPVAEGTQVLSSYTMLAIPSEKYQPLFFDEEKHLSTPFKNRMERFRYFENLKLSFPLQMIRYDPGGTACSVNVLWKAPGDFDPNEMMTQGARILKEVEPQFSIYHTRQMKKEFKEKCKKMGAQIPPHLLRKIYADLTGDATCDQNKEMDERVRQAVIGDDPDLIIDMRHINKGRPGDTFKSFFDALEKKVESLAAADERRHGVAHVSEWVSIRDLIEQVSKQLPSGTLIPSESTVCAK